jgi:hypothetical protein
MISPTENILHYVPAELNLPPAHSHALLRRFDGTKWYAFAALLHRPLPGDASQGFRAILRRISLPQVAPQKRTFHVLVHVDTSRATDTPIITS